MILRTHVQCSKGPGNHDPSLFLHSPTFIQSKNYFSKMIQFLLYLLSKSIRNVFMASGKAIMQTFPLVPTMVAPTISTYVNNKILTPTFFTWLIPSHNFSLKIRSVWRIYESSQRILFPEGATTISSEVFESPIWDMWTICNLDFIEINTGVQL